jgi:hypothetical protein
MRDLAFQHTKNFSIPEWQNASRAIIIEGFNEWEATQYQNETQRRNDTALVDAMRGVYWFVDTCISQIHDSFSAQAMYTEMLRQAIYLGDTLDSEETPVLHQALVKAKGLL